LSKKRVSAQQKLMITQRARGCCEYCFSQIKFSNQSFSVEHIIPESLGGPTTLDNLALACQSCNNHKYTKTTGYDLVSATTVPLYHPRHQKWIDHFAWNEDCTLMIGLTPIGRVTIDTLHLNKSGLVNLRRILYSVGEHPPAIE